MEASGMNQTLKTTLKTLLALAVLYVVFFTFVWSLIVETIVIGTFSLVHWNTPKEDRPPFRHYIREQPAFRAICDAGNWVADITQPLISDEVMIAHWQKHHKQWEESLDKKPVNAQPEDYRRYEAYVRSIGLTRINYEPLMHSNPDRFANMTPPPELGASSRMRACVGKGGSGKAYEYIPETPLLTVGDQLIRPSVLKFAQENRIKPEGNLQVESTNRAHYTWSMRRLSPHWYIIRYDS
jgi:hypothetical protein